MTPLPWISTLATWFGCGRAPKAPGTFGTLGAIPLLWGLQSLGALSYMLFVLVLTLIAVWVAHLYEIQVGRHDSPEVVIDEVVGFLITMTWVPWSWFGVGLGFLVFRFLDVLKPWPIRWVDQKVKGGVGAVADDVLAGIIGNLFIQALLQNGYWV